MNFLRFSDVTDFFDSESTKSFKLANFEQEMARELAVCEDEEGSESECSYEEQLRCSMSSCQAGSLAAIIETRPAINRRNPELEEDNCHSAEDYIKRKNEFGQNRGATASLCLS
mmetsp:Transcript_39118/g.51164  ORF Transcript_39118/g.51164 Transcript_39118/m.51164 type:complete len:114 (+) Transcript_39118:592-933(+)